MKDYKEIIKEMTEEQVIRVMQALGADSYKTDSDGNLMFRSICHNSNSYKLYYYPTSKNFYCFRDSENFNIFSLAMKIRQCDFFEAYRYICSILGIDTGNAVKSGIVFNGTNHIKDDWEFINKYIEDNDVPKEQHEEIFNKETLDFYSDLYWQGWIQDNISVESMQKFGIRYDVNKNAIIIPHYNINNELVGIRCRNLDENAFAKYCPAQIEDKWYAHSLASHLYGLSKNKDIIKNLGKVMLCESEKSVMQSETYYPNNNFVVACCGSNISKKQIDLLIGLGVKTVILGFDFDYMFASYEDEDFLRYKNNLLKKAKKLLPYFNVEAVIDIEPRMCGYKDSPTDNGKEILEKLLDKKVQITEELISQELG